MSSHIEDGRRPVLGARAVHRENARIREIAQLRARRAARLATERAAGQRRLLVSAATALATVAVLVLAAVSAVGWTWIALPAALLAAALATSRWAAVRSEAAGRSEDARLRQLREGLDAHGVRVPSAAGPASGPARAPGGGTGVADAKVSSSVSGAAREGGATDDPAGGSTPPGTEAHRDDVDGDAGTGQPLGPQEDVAARVLAVEPRTWSVSAVPAPTYASRARVVGREVHADTDLRGIPAVRAEVPARPQASGHGVGDARSTEDVAASQPLVFDLDAVLDNRRAQ